MAADEKYIVDLCDRVLGALSERQYRFDFLRGDRGHRLPVDAYYPAISLAIEYHEVQHTRSVPFMDKRMTASGVSRDVQRRLYDDRRRKVLPENGINLIILDYTMFRLKPSMRLLRESADEDVIRRHLNGYLGAS